MRPSSAFSRAAVVLGLILGSVLVAPGSAEATSCASHTYWDGYYYPDTLSNITHWGEGDSGTIVTRLNYICPGSGDHQSSAWVMEQPSDASGYAQAGYWRLPGFTVDHLFAQWAAPGTSVDDDTIFGPSAVDGSTHTYKVQYVASCTCEYMYIDGGFVARTYFNVIANWPRPWAMALLGEAHSTADDIPGTSTAKTNFTALKKQLYSDDSYANTYCSGFETDADWSPDGHYPDGVRSGIGADCQSFSVWTHH